MPAEQSEEDDCCRLPDDYPQEEPQKPDGPGGCFFEATAAHGDRLHHDMAALRKRFYHDDHDQLRRHLANFINACNFGRRLNTLKGLTPWGFICKQWTSEPDRFIIDPSHQVPGLNT